MRKKKKETPHVLAFGARVREADGRLLAARKKKRITPPSRVWGEGGICDPLRIAFGVMEGVRVWSEKRGRQREKENLLTFGIKKGVVLMLTRIRVAMSARSAMRPKPPLKSPQTGSTCVILNSIGCMSLRMLKAISLAEKVRIPCVSISCATILDWSIRPVPRVQLSGDSESHIWP
jgi:hypothetical protein